MRRSLLVQLLGTYGLFVAIVLGAGLLVNSIVQRQLQVEAQRADLALARAIALQIDIQLRNARNALNELVWLDDVREGDDAQKSAAFRAFKAARQDVDRVYWLDETGVMRVSVPTNPRTLGTDFSEERLFRRAVDTSETLVEAGVVDLTTYNPVVVLAQALRDGDGHLLGIVATNLLLDDLSAPLQAITSKQPNRLLISVIDEEGQLIATPVRERLLQPVVDELPGADQALAGQEATRLGLGPGAEEWLYSAEPVPGVGWAVVVQRPTSDALAVVRSFGGWLTAAALIFGAGGLLFWYVLIGRVVRPLQLLAASRRTLRGNDPVRPPAPSGIEQRDDEVGNLARSLHDLDHAVARRLNELRILLDTSTAVVSTLDPGAVSQRIIAAVRQLVDVQAAAVLVPDEQGALRVLASEGHSEYYHQAIHIPVDDPTSPSALALRERRPVQLIADQSSHFPPISYAEGFRSLLAIPIISPHVGGVALVVYRVRLQPFSSEEIDLLLTFANYATLAWEHAVLYERSDERLRVVAAENEQLYKRAMQEKQMLAAIVGSMSDGLILTSGDGTVRYANRRAGQMIGAPDVEMPGGTLTTIHNALRGAAIQPVAYDQARADAEAGKKREWLLELEHAGRRRGINLRLFDVHDDEGQLIGRGMLLRDVTREREIDQFKTTLLGAVGHELRTPLAAIKGHASTLLQDDVVWSPGDERHFLQTISDEADRLAQLVSNLLDLSRLEAGLLALRHVPWKVDRLVARVVQQVQRPGVQIIVEVPGDLPPVAADGPRVEVVIQNVLNNAIAYGGGTVRVCAAQRGDAVQVSVVDNGGGIDPEELAHIFERFYRAQRGVQRRSNGTGLGLAISKAFVEAHGGLIWAESDAAGTTIAFTLPVVEAAAHNASPQPTHDGAVVEVS
jgi:PAS domain S-box-containing protein